MITQANPITYQQQSIIVPSTDGPREILATVAVSTGLAYNYDSGISSRGYVITALNTDGYAIMKPPVTVTSERVARLWLEGVLQLTDWTSELFLRKLYLTYCTETCAIDDGISQEEVDRQLYSEDARISQPLSQPQEEKAR